MAAMLHRGGFLGMGLDVTPGNRHVCHNETVLKGTRMRIRAGYIFACALFVTMSAAPAMAEGLFGAIAFSPSTGQYGWAKNQSAEDGASAEAVSGCGVDDCNAVVTFPNCAALSVGDGYGMGFSKAESIADAEGAALASCDGFTTNCIVSASVCNDE